MEKKVARTRSFKDYSSIKGKRYLEVCCFILPAVAIVVVTVCILISKQNIQSSDAVFCTPNSSQYMENITEYLLSAKPFTNGSLATVDGMIYPLGYYWSDSSTTIWGCPCLLRPCIYKCCGKYETHFYTEYDYEGSIIRGAECVNHHVLFDQNKSDVISAQNLLSHVRMEIENNHFLVIDSNNCNGRGMYFLDDDEKEKTYLLEDGRLYSEALSKPFWTFTEFCVESSNDSEVNHFMICFGEESEESAEEEKLSWTYYWKGAGMIFSVPCLLITLLVYALLPDLNNLHGKSLMHYVTCLAVGYSCLAILNLEILVNVPKPICAILGFVIQFSVLTSFFWLNVMCFDIWWVFSGLKPLRGSQKATESVKYLLYSLYAWGCPIIILVITLIMEYAPSVPDNAIKPQMGIERCFFKENEAKLLYFYLPIGVLVYLNVVMFITTALRFKSHSKSVKKLQRGDSRRHCKTGNSTTDIQRFSLYLKLFVIMGVNWVLELASFFLNSKSFTEDLSFANQVLSLLWLASDLANALQGALILYMFVCKKPILRQVRDRYSSRLRSFSAMNSDLTNRDSSIRRKISQQSTTSSCDTAA